MKVKSVSTVIQLPAQLVTKFFSPSEIEKLAEDPFCKDSVVQHIGALKRV